MGVIRINGVTISTRGSNIEVSNGRVWVDGKDVTPDQKEIHIEIQGDVTSLQVDACETVQVTGSAGKVSTMSGNVTCGDVLGSVQTMSGDVTCGRVGGSVSTMSGDVRGVARSG